MARAIWFLLFLAYLGPAWAAEPRLTAEVHSLTGTPTLFINGQPKNPLMFWGTPRSNRGPIPVQSGLEWQTFSTSFEAFEDQPLAAIHVRMGGGKANRIWIRNVSFVEGGKPDMNMVRHPGFDTGWENDWALFVRTDTGAKATAHAEADGLCVDIADGGADPMYVHLFEKGHTLVAGRKYSFSVEIRSQQPQIVELLVVEAGNDWTQYTSSDPGPVLEEIRLAASAGVHIHSFTTVMPWSTGGDKPADYTAVDNCFDTIIQADPDALLLPRFMVDAPPSWKQQHATEVMLYDDGDRGQASVASEIWRRDAEASLRRFIDHIEQRYGNRVIGYHPCCQHTGEWFYDRTWEARFSGFEPAFVEGFRRFLRDKYAGDPRALQRAWRDDQVAFDSVSVPSREERLHAGLHVFRDPSSECRLIDFNEYLQAAMVEPLEGFARVIKDATARRKLVVLFYGYLFEIASLPHGPAASGHLAMGRLLQCPDVDILCAPISYGERGLIGSSPFMAAVDSVQLHGKLWLNEDDTRTYLAGKDEGYGRVDTLEQTRWVHRRNFGQVLTRHMTCWWMDLPCTGWLASPEIWADLGELRGLYDREIGKPSRYRPEIAVIVDERSPLFWAANSALSHPLLSALRIQFNRIGAPVGLYLLSDLVAGRVPESKMYLFPNASALTADQRAALAENLHRDNKVAVWLYGAGFIQDSADVKHMSELLEMSIERAADAQDMTVRWADCDEPLLRGLNGQTTPAGARVALPLLVPASKGQGSRILARFAGTSVPAVAVRETPTYTTVYASLLGVPSTFLRACARKAGVFLYTDTDEVIQSDGRWLFITATSAGKKRINLPGPRDVRDVVSDEVAGDGVDHWEVELQAGETRAYEIR